jgi:hypothetical protein
MSELKRALAAILGIWIRAVQRICHGVDMVQEYYWTPTIVLVGGGFILGIALMMQFSAMGVF